jgi:hypothetical protein
MLRSRLFLLPVATALLLSACSTQRVTTLDARPEAMSGVGTVAIATITSRPSLSMPTLSHNENDLVNVLTKFETEFTNALMAQNFNVVAPSYSGKIYSHAMEYEEQYVQRSYDDVVNVTSEDQAAYRAWKLKHDSSMKTDRVTSLNTRIFPDAANNLSFKLPVRTKNGGALDERFTSNPMRGAIGDLTQKMGADAYILIDGQIVLSSRKEGFLLGGLTGGTRFVTFDGTAQLVRSDGTIISVEKFRHQANFPIASDIKQPYSPEYNRGTLGNQRAFNNENLLEASYQAVRAAALDLAARYGKYRFGERDDD